MEDSLFVVYVTFDHTERQTTMVRGQDSPMPCKRRYRAAARRVCYLLHGSDSIHLVDLRSETFDLDANVRSLLDDLLAVVRPLWRRSVCVEGDVGWDHLCLLVDGYLHIVHGSPYIASHESLQRAAVHEKSCAKHGSDNTVHLDSG